VLLRVRVTAEGAAGELAVQRSSGFPRLDRVALEPFAQWRLVPGRIGGEPIASGVHVPLAFTLE